MDCSTLPGCLWDPGAAVRALIDWWQITERSSASSWRLWSPPILTVTASSENALSRTIIVPTEARENDEIIQMIIHFTYSEKYLEETLFMKYSPREI